MGFTLLANVALLASARAIIVGPDIAREYRYQTESGALFVLCAGLAFLPLLGARETNEERPDVPRTYERRGIVLLASAAVAAAAITSSTRYVDLWQSRNPTEAYIGEVRHSLATAEHKPVPLVDTGIPQTLLWAFRYPENTYSHVLRPFADQTSYPRSAVDRLYMFDDQGRLSPVGHPTHPEHGAERRLRLPPEGPAHHDPPRRAGHRRRMVDPDRVCQPA